MKVGTPICAPSKGMLDIGRVVSIESNHKEVPSARKGMSVAVRIANEENPTLTYGRQFDHTDTLYSKVSLDVKVIVVVGCRFVGLFVFLFTKITALVGRCLKGSIVIFPLEPSYMTSFSFDAYLIPPPS